MATTYISMIQTIQKVFYNFLYLFKIVKIVHNLIRHLGFSKIDKKVIFFNLCKTSSFRSNIEDNNNPNCTIIKNFRIFHVQHNDLWVRERVKCIYVNNNFNFHFVFWVTKRVDLYFCKIWMFFFFNLFANVFVSRIRLLIFQSVGPYM
jgi:hypothetical protein